MPYKWRVVGMLWWISFFNYADRQAIFSVFPLLEREMGLTTVQLGLLGSGFAWVYGLGAPFAGMVVDRFKRKTVILGGICFCGARPRDSARRSTSPRRRRSSATITAATRDRAPWAFIRPRSTWERSAAATSPA
jgi:MFS family permease